MRCCEFLLEGLELRYNAIALCNRVNHIGGGDIVLEYYDEKKSKSLNFDVNGYIKKRQEIILKNQEEELYPNCRGCSAVHDCDIGNNTPTRISSIVLHHWTKCNSNCIYCYTNSDKEYFNKRKNYDAFPVLKKLEKNKILTKGGLVNWAGGEISCLPEFKKITSFLDKMDYFSMYNSSGIVYEKTVEKHLKTRKGILMVSVDAGSENSHKKIKQVQSYDKVWKNLLKYSNACTYKPLLYAKYIILKEINNNTEEIKQFLYKCKETGIAYVLFDIDLYYFRENRDNIPKEMLDLFYFAYDFAKSLNINMLLYSNSSVLFSQGKYADSFWDDKKYESGNHYEKIQAVLQIYQIKNDNIINKYHSIGDAAQITGVPYEKILKSCSKYQEGKKYYVNDCIYSYVLDAQTKFPDKSIGRE